MSQRHRKGGESARTKSDLKRRIAPGKKYKICQDIRRVDPADILTQRFDHQFKSRWKGSNASTEAEGWAVL